MFIFTYVLMSLSVIITAQEPTNYQIYNNITYQKCHDTEQLNFNPFPIEYQPDHQSANPTIAETFILTIPNGCAYGINGIIITENQVLTDLIWSYNAKHKAILGNLDLAILPQPTKINGRVAVIAQAGSLCFYHWMAEVLGKLALLEMHNIEYDYLYVPQIKPYMKESLKIWGIDMRKIIQPSKKNEYIQADELIVPSHVNRVQPDCMDALASYPSAWIINHLRKKYLPKIQELGDKKKIYSKKIFISRNDANIRKFTNEDDLFNKLKADGFEKYYLSKLSFLEQIALFAQANIIVAPHGAGLAHLIFTQPGTQLVELYQARPDATYWYLSQSQILQLRHTCIQTCPIDKKNGGHVNTQITQSAIDEILEIVCTL